MVGTQTTTHGVVQDHVITLPPVDGAISHGSGHIQFIDTIEPLPAEGLTTPEDVKTLFRQAKSNHFDIKSMRKLLQLKKPYLSPCSLNAMKREALPLDA